MKTLFLSAAIVAFTINSSFALEVIRARYGTDKRYNDVSDIVQRYADQGVRSFYVNNDSMRGDPDKGDKKFLTVEYVNKGRRYRETAREGTHFRFEGPLVGGGNGYHFYGPPAGRPLAELTVYNESNTTAQIYSLSEWGSWQWVGRVSPGRSLVAPAVIGQEWRATDSAGRTLDRTRVNRPRDRMVIGGGFLGGGGGPDDYYYGGGGGYVGRLTIENSLRSPVRVYTVNPGRDWQFVGIVNPRSSESFRTEPGRRWIVTDLANRVLENVDARPGDSLLRVP